MFQRSCNTPKTNSFFLFGARGTGKSTLLKERFQVPNEAYVDLLRVATERELSRNPDLLETWVRALPPGTSHVILDEIQKIPSLLDVVHRLIEDKTIGVHFVMTGSSARKLKAGGANLLAGRAFMRALFPLTAEELGGQFDLNEALEWGTLPKIFACSNAEEKRDFLEAYAQTYLKEEVWAEQIVRKLEPFRRFLEVAAQLNGKIINATKISRDVGVDVKTIQSYYAILEDTLVGFHVDSFHTSLRKRLRQAPKFYFFDPGVARALGNMLSVPPSPRTSYFGELFEQFVVNEIFRLNSYQKKDFRITYLLTSAGYEIDLVLERPGKPLAFIEIKSTSAVTEDQVSSLLRFAVDFPEAEFFCFSLDERAKKFSRVHAVHWRQGIAEL